MAVQHQKRLYDVRAIARDFPLDSWLYRHNPARKKHKLDRLWVGPWKVVRPPDGPNVMWVFKLLLMDQSGISIRITSNLALLLFQNPFGRSFLARWML